MTQHRVAVLYQALEPPVINGVRKPKKPGGKWAPRDTQKAGAARLIKSRLPGLRGRHCLCLAEGLPHTCGITR
jgi:hypothetical protein